MSEDFQVDSNPPLFTTRRTSFPWLPSWELFVNPSAIGLNGALVTRLIGLVKVNPQLTRDLQARAFFLAACHRTWARRHEAEFTLGAMMKRP